MKGNGSQPAATRPLAPRERRAVEMLAAGRGVVEVAAELEVARETVWRWKQQPAFEAEMNRAAREVDAEAREVLRAGRLEAVRLLRQMLDSPGAKDGAKVAAARALLGACPLALQEPGSDDPEVLIYAAEAEADKMLTDRASDASTRDLLRSVFRGGAG